MPIPPGRLISSRGAVSQRHCPVLGVVVEALVEPGLLELVGADHAVPVLVAELVDRHDLDDRGRGRTASG